MAVLLIADVTAGLLGADVTARALNAVLGLGEVDLLVVGNEVKAAAEAASRMRGVARILTVEDVRYANGLAEPIADLIVSLAHRYEHIVAPATATGKNLLPRIAALLDFMIIPDITSVIDSTTFERPIYAGNAIQTVKSTDRIKLLTIRVAGFEPVAMDASAPISAIPPAEGFVGSEWVADKVALTDRPALTSARIVVSGGRGVGSENDFQLVERLADKLNGAIGASRAAVDAGFASSDRQVGQTGKIVAPDLYIAIGISGAIQHLAGMKDSKVIVAINKDEEAPIFQVADYGLVADLFQAVPDLIEKL